MKANLTLFFLLVFTLASLDGVCAVGTSNSLAATAVGVTAESGKSAKAIEKQQKKEERLRKLVEKIEKKIEKKQAKKGIKATTGVWDNSKFRLGVLIGLGGVALSILAAIIGGSFFWILSSIALLAGVILIIWGLVEYSG